MSNFESFVTPKAVRLVKTLGNIENPFGQVKLSVENLGDYSTLIDLKTWRLPGKKFSDMSTKQLISQEGKVKSHKYADSLKFEPGKKVTMKSLLQLNKQVSDKFADLLTDLWAQIKTDSSTYLNFEKFPPVFKQR